MSDFESKGDSIMNDDNGELRGFVGPESDFVILDDGSEDLVIYGDGLTPEDVNSATNIEIVEPRRHDQFGALIQSIFSLKGKLDKIAELYGHDATMDDVVKILEKMARFVDGLEPDDDDLNPVWKDYASASSAIAQIEKDMAEADSIASNDIEGDGLEKRRYREGYKNSKNKLVIPGFQYIFREDMHSYTTEHQGAHFALEDRNEVEVGVVITLDEFDIVHLEPHGDKEKGKSIISAIFRSQENKDLQIINDFTKHRFGKKQINERRKYSQDGFAVDGSLPARFFFKKE